MDISDANVPQRAAITHLRGPCLVLAGPGSGKTFTITKRILYLLEQGAAPEGILVVTFTRQAALSMQGRFLRMSGAGGAVPACPVCFGTFHSVFYHILKQSNILKADSPLKSADKKRLLLPVLKSFDQKQIQCGEISGLQAEPGEDVPQLLSAISYYKNTLEMEAASRLAPARWRQDFEAVFWEYDRAVKRTGRYDFDDMLYRCLILLQEDKGVREYWRKRFPFILIDEFQDINPVQYEVVGLLSARPHNIFAVGDDDQSIYGFRGSDPGCMRRFEEEFRARRILLDTNYRSGREIVQASLAVIGENRNRFEKSLRAADRTAENSKPGDGVGLLSFPDREKQYRYMADRLRAYAAAGEGCAVLFRTNSYMQGFASRLKAADVPYEMRERAASIYEHFIVKDIMAYIQVARGKAAREQFLLIMNRPSRYISREAVGEGPADVRAVMEYYGRARLSGRQESDVRDTLTRFERQLQILKGLSLPLSVEYILRAMGYGQYLRDVSRGRPEKLQEWMELLEWLREDAAGFASLGEWEAFQREYAGDLERRGRDAGPPKTGKACAVQLLTVHGAKGLEFDRVWIPDCNEKIFPHGRLQDEKQVEEERRILYVAMTRAKKSLELLYLTGTKERPRLPSRFLNPLYSSAKSSNSQLSRYSSKASATFSYSSSSSI